MKKIYILLAFLFIFICSPVLANDNQILTKTMTVDLTIDKNLLTENKRSKQTTNQTIISSVIRADMPFSDLGICWIAEAYPEGSAIVVDIKTSQDSQEWTDWREVNIEDTRNKTAEHKFIGGLFCIDQQDRIHNFIQYRITLTPSLHLEYPILKKITFTYIDSGITPEHLMKNPKYIEYESTSEISTAKTTKTKKDQTQTRPSIISRSGWGADESKMTYTPQYKPVTHVVIHHTATPNTEEDWPARIRAIYLYHAETQGWGDIGYNYLIDPNGNIYEGRFGGDDVVGSHAYGYNYGTSGIAFIGTYTNESISDKMTKAANELLSWIISKNNIDPLGSGADCNGNVYPYICGHRDVGSTECPGEMLYNNLKNIRNNLNDRSTTTENVAVDIRCNGETFIIDDLSPAFVKSGKEGNWKNEQTGYNDHMTWTYAVDDPADCFGECNSAKWLMNILDAGEYDVYAYIPDFPDNGNLSKQARYKIWTGDNGGRVYEPWPKIDQNEHINNWALLERIYFHTGGAAVKLIDETGESYNLLGRKLAFDAIKMVCKSDISQSKPDLKELGTWMRDGKCTIGEETNIQLKVINTGNTLAGKHQSQVYISKDQFISKTDIEIGPPIQFPALSPGEDENGKLFDFEIPDSINPGEYYIGAIIDINGDVDEGVEGEKNNAGTESVNKIIVNSGTVQQISKPYVTPSPPYAYKEVTIHWDKKNVQVYPRVLIKLKATAIPINIWSTLANVDNTGSYTWYPKHAQNTIIRIKYLDKAGNWWDLMDSDPFDIKRVPDDVHIERPEKPKIYTYYDQMFTSEVKLTWRKVIDARHIHNADSYILQYSNEKDKINSDEEKNIEPFVPGKNMYESLSYTITEYNGESFKDDTTYYFRIKGKNPLGSGEWSDIHAVTIMIPDAPAIDETYQRPRNGETNVEKLPILEWRGLDKDGDELEYYIKIGTDPNNMRRLRSFSPDNDFDFESENEPMLSPNTTYYWQVLVREKNCGRDCYGGEYITTDAPWNFTTGNVGSDLAIVNVEQVGEVKPDSEVLFRVTLRNKGSEIADNAYIVSSYLKNGKEYPFKNGSAVSTKKLAFGEEEIVEIKVQFMGGIHVDQSGETYDNILVSGESQVKFYFYIDDDQDIRKTNNEKIVSIFFEDSGGPVIEVFRLTEDLRMEIVPTSTTPSRFWAKMGNIMEIWVRAQDDLLISQCNVDYKLDNNSNWKNICTHTHNDNNLSHTCPWEIPENIEPTDEAIIKVTLIDSQGNETIKESDIFSIYSNNLKASIEASNTTFQVNKPLNFKISYESDYDIKSINVDLNYSAFSDDIYYENDDNGLEIKDDTYSWTPDENKYASTKCTLRLTIRDIKRNEFIIESEIFEIKPDTELPAPFNKSIVLFDDEYNFPPGIEEYKDQDINTKFVKIDDSNDVHSIVKHSYFYYKDINPEDRAADLYVSEQNHYYVYYDTEKDQITEKVKVVDSLYDVIDLAVINDTPYILLKSNDGRDIFAYSYKSNNSFVQPIIFQNKTVPSLNNPTRISSTSEYGMSYSNQFIYANGYLWELDINKKNEIKRFSFSNGRVGSEDEIFLQITQGEYRIGIIKPVVSNNDIYFIDEDNSALIKIDTSSLIAKIYYLPFSINDEDKAKRTALGSVSGNIFIFGNGAVYKLENEKISLKDKIKYRYHNQDIDYSTTWDTKVENYAKAVLSGNYIYLILDGNFTTPSGSSTDNEILLFDHNNFTFKKTIAEAKTRVVGDDFLYIGNDKVLITTGRYFKYSSSYHYSIIFKLLNLITGDVIQIGKIDPANDEYITLGYIEGNIFAFIGNAKNRTTDVYQLTIDNINVRPIQIEGLNFITFNDQLYITWYNGQTFDGSWNFEKNDLSSDVKIKNQFIKIYPDSGRITDFFDTYIGYEFNCNHNILSRVDRGRIYSLNSDFTVNKLVYDDNNRIHKIFYSSFDSKFHSAVTNYNYDNNHYKFEISLIDDNVIYDNQSPVTFYSWSNETIAASFENEVIVVGDSDERKSKYLISKIDLTTKEHASIRLGQDDSESYVKQADINKNKFVAVSWYEYLAVADLSGDLIPPQVKFSNVNSTIQNASDITLTWNVSDNKDELIKLELYKRVDYTETLVKSFSDTSINTYPININETSADNVLFKLVAYDFDDNVSSDTVQYTVTEPIVFESFNVNKSTVKLGDKIIFSWTASGHKNSTLYTVYKRKIGNSEWDEYFQITGKTSFIIYAENFIGEYEFKIISDKNSMMLPITVKVEGEIVVFDYSLFTPVNQMFYVEDRVIKLFWGLEEALSDTVAYDIYLKLESESKFNKIGSTIQTNYRYFPPENINAFEWKVKATCKGCIYESKPFAFSLKALNSPVVNNLKIMNHHTSNPNIVITFNQLPDIYQYAIFRSENKGSFINIGESTENNYTDTTVVYGKTYTYYIQSMIDHLNGEPGNSKEIFTAIKPMNRVIINNQNHSFIGKNEITVSYKPDPEICFEKYQILIGTNADNLTQYCITKDRSVFINNLDYDTDYLIEIHPLDHNNQKTIGSPGILVFTTPLRPDSTIMDMIVVLKLLAGFNSDEIQIPYHLSGIDLSGDKKVGLQDVISLLKNISE